MLSLVILLVLAFLLGGGAGAALAWYLRGRRQRTLDGETDGDAPRGRFYTLKIVAITAVVTLAVAAGAGYAVLRMVFRSKPMNKPSVNRAVEDFRKASAGATSGGGTAPAAGVYTYRASGFSHVEVPLLGTDHRDFPETVPGLLLPDGDCWDLSVRFFEQHRWTPRYCRGGEAPLRLVSSRNENTHFGREIDSTSMCTPDAIVRADMSAGDSWKQTCESKKRPGRGWETALTFVGIEKVTVDDEEVDAHHLRRDIEMSGRQSGTTTRETWYAVSSGLLVRLRQRGRGSGMAKFEQDYELTLTSFTPTN